MLDFLQWDRGYTFVFINNTPNMMSVTLYTHSVSPFLGADLVDYLEPNELQLEESFPCIRNP